jgi:GTPase SAR1 family protein
MRILAILTLLFSILNAASQPVSPETPLRYKVVVVGQSGVGKSSLTIRFSKGAFFDRLETTMGGTGSTIKPAII